MRLDSAASEERDLLELVEQALDQPAVEREAWLETNCGSGSEKLVRARRLLKRIGDTQPDSYACLLYTSPSPRDQRGARMPSSA